MGPQARSFYMLQIYSLSIKPGYAILTGNNWFLLEDKAKCETVNFYFSKQDRNEPFNSAASTVKISWSGMSTGLNCHSMSGGSCGATCNNDFNLTWNLLKA